MRTDGYGETLKYGRLVPGGTMTGSMRDVSHTPPNGTSADGVWRRGRENRENADGADDAGDDPADE